MSLFDELEEVAVGGVLPDDVEVVGLEEKTVEGYDVFGGESVVDSQLLGQLSENVLFDDR